MVLKFKELHEDVFIEKNKKELFTYETWCRMLDGIDSHLLVESNNKEFLFEDWWSDYSHKQQAKYVKDHPDSDQAKQAKTKGLKGKDDDDDGKLKRGIKKGKELTKKGVEKGKELTKKGVEKGKEYVKKGIAAKHKELSTTDKILNKLNLIPDDAPPAEKIQIKNIYNGVKDHIGDVVKAAGISNQEAIAAYKEPGVYGIMKGFGHDLKNGANIIKGGMKTITKALEGITGELTKTAPFKALKAGTMEVDKFLDKHPRIKRIGGVAVAGLAAAQWYHMSFSGDFDADQDVSTVGDALAGNYSITDLLTSPSGVAGLGLLAVGLATTGGLSTLWSMENQMDGLALALARNGLQRLGKLEEAEKVFNTMKEKMGEWTKKVTSGGKKESFSEMYSSVIEKDEHKKSQQYKKLSPKMKDSVDLIFKKMDDKPSDFLNSFEKTIKDVSKKYKVPEKELLSYFEREMLTI